MSIGIYKNINVNYQFIYNMHNKTQIFIKYKNLFFQLNHHDIQLNFGSCSPMFKCCKIHFLNYKFVIHRHRLHNGPYQLKHKT